MTFFDKTQMPITKKTIIMEHSSKESSAEKRFVCNMFVHVICRETQIKSNKFAKKLLRGICKKVNEITRKPKSSLNLAFAKTNS